MAQRLPAHAILDQLRAIYASRKLTQAKLEQQSGGKLKQTSVSRLLNTEPEDPGFNKLLWFAQAMDVDFLALVADAIGAGAPGQRRSTVERADLEALRTEARRVYEGLDAVLEARADPDHARGRGA